MSWTAALPIIRFDWKAWRREPLFWGLVASTVFHLLFLAVKFVPPKELLIKPIDSQLEVILLNAGTDTKPSKAEVLAQVSMEGGGDREKGRSKSPLPAEDKLLPGDSLKAQQKRVQDLELQQQQLLALAKAKALNNPPPSVRDLEQAKEGPDPSDSQAVIATMQAQIARDIEAYSKRPRRLTFGVNALGVSFAQYVDDWATRIEELGTSRYPPEARGKYYGSLIVTVEIRRDGSVANFVINKPSKHSILNQAVKRIIYSGQPYDRFSADMTKEGDILQIVRTWTFTNEGLETEAVVLPTTPSSAAKPSAATP